MKIGDTVRVSIRHDDIYGPGSVGVITEPSDSGYDWRVQIGRGFGQYYEAELEVIEDSDVDLTININFVLDQIDQLVDDALDLVPSGTVAEFAALDTLIDAVQDHLNNKRDMWGR